MTQVRFSVHVAAVLNYFLDDPDSRHYGLQILRALDMGSGTVYPILKRLTKAGWLDEALDETNAEYPGRVPRRWYKLTDEGRRAGPAFTGSIRNLRPGSNAPAVELAEWERWYAPGSVVAELEYAGNGTWWAEETRVVRVTKSQVFTATGRRFWRKGSMARVGYTSKRLAGISTALLRLARRDNPNVVAKLGPPPPGTIPTIPVPIPVTVTSTPTAS